MGADIDLEGAVYVLAGVSPAGLTADEADAFREACARDFVKNKSAEDPEDKGLDALVKETLAGLQLSEKDLDERQLANVRAVCGACRYLAGVLTAKNGGTASEGSTEDQGASEESLGDVLVEVSNPRVEVQITATSVAIRPKTEEQRLWLSTADAKFLASVVNNRAEWVSDSRVPRGAVRRSRWRLR